MTPVALKTNDGQTLRKYLLGDASLEEQQALELWLMSSEEGYDLLVAAEDDLIDDSLNGQLNEYELKRFNEHFLAAPERQRKVQFGRSLHRFISAKLESLPVAGESAEKASSAWENILSFFRYRPQMAYVLSVLVFVFAAGSLWSVFRTVELQRQLNSVAQQLANAQQEREDFKRQLSESQSFVDKLQTRFQEIEQASATSKAPPSPTLVAVNLLPGISRSSSAVPKVTIAEGSRLIQLTLILLDDDYNTYRVTLLDSGGKELFAKDGLPSTPFANGKAVVFTAPSELISGGDYTVSLAGIADSRPPENISSFYFQAVRQ
jgi:hypothetical protein